MDNEIEKITQALINGDPLPIEDFVPKSRSEEYLKSALMNTKIEDLPNPQSRLDVLLCALNDDVHKEYRTKFEEGYSEGYDDGVEAGHTEDYEDGYANGYEAGTTEGNAEGYETGHADGYDSGREVGHDEGYEEGYISGHTAGHTEAYNSGYESGYNKGYDMGHTEDYDDGYTAGQEAGIEAGKQAEYDRFWDSLTNNNTKTSYLYTFGNGWNIDIFKPPYPLKIVNAEYMFMNFDSRSSNTASRGLVIDETVIDFTNATSIAYMFSNAHIRTMKMNTIPTKAKSMTSLFRHVNINKHQLKDVVLGIHETMTFDTYAFWASSIENVSFVEGSVIGTSITFQNCGSITPESAKNIINHLKNYKGTDKELTYKLTLHSTVWANLEASETASNGGTWKDYVVDVLGWQVA